VRKHKFELLDSSTGNSSWTGEIQQSQMMRIISGAIARWLELEGAVSSSERTLFEYAAYSLLFGLLPFGIVLALGMCFHMVQEGIILIIPFMLLRKFSGGFHLKSSGLCMVTTTGVLAFAMGLIKYIVYWGQTEIVSFSVCLSVVSLCIFSPVDNQARKLSDKERIVFRKVARILSIIFLAVYFLLSLNTELRYTSAFGVGILLVGLLQIPCVVGRFFCENRTTKTTR